MGQNKETEKSSDFLNEIAVQNLINLETSNDQESATPYIIYDTIIDPTIDPTIDVDNNIIKKILNIEIKRRDGGADRVGVTLKDELDDYYNEKKDTLGLIAMEFVEDAKTLLNLISNGKHSPPANIGF